MKLSLRLLLLLPFIFVVVGCPADDETPPIQSRPYLEVYNEDIAEIEDFMESHYITVDASYNVSFTKITATTPGTPIFDALDTSASQNNPAKPLKFKTISKEGVDHKLYYLKLNEGMGSNPTRLDSVFTSYKGYKTDLSSFDAASSPTWFQLQEVIQGWQEVFPEFKSSNGQTINPDGTITYNNFGAGVMFVPSGLAYFSGTGGGAIGSYTPIIFSFKLMNVRYKDHDGDKILSKDEYGGPASGTPLDTDGDGKPDYADFDDDNDGKLTKNELSDVLPAIQKINGYYNFNDIPDCNGNRPAITKRKHLSNSCQ
jgi:FKBP-type peptidyl-prolyl cis-trans isomerase FkpA